MLQSDGTVNGRPAKPSYRYSGHLPTAFHPHVDRRRWLTWNYVWSEKQQKWTKPPCSAFTGRVCSATDPNNFGTFDQAIATMLRCGLDGIGFGFFKEDGLVGMDLDNSLTDGGSVKEWAYEIVKANETYCEISPSGEGLHIIAAGSMAMFKNDAAGVEVYVERRYFTFTGDLWPDAPDAILPAPATLAAVEKHRPQRGQKQQQQRTTGDNSPFDRINAIALDKLDAWIPILFPTAHNKYPPTWRVPAKDLGDSYEEDLVCGPNGIRYFGSGKGFNPVTLVQEYGSVDGARAAALWLCEQIGIDPENIGFATSQREREGAKPQTEEEEQFEKDLVAHIKLTDLARAKNRKALQKKYGMTAEELKDALKARQRQRPNAPEDVPPSREELEQGAADLISCPDILKAFAEDVGKRIAGEERTVKILLLAGTSRLFRKPMSVVVKGPSSGGKSEVRRAALAYFPPEEVVIFTATSEKALLFEKKSFEHKILSMAEAINEEEAGLQNLLLRELISEGRLDYKMTMKVGDSFETVAIEKQGPVSFWITTTANFLHPENETRLLSTEIDDTSEQTGRVLKKVAEGHTGRWRADIDYEPWHAHQRWLALGPTEVVIPFADLIAEYIPPRAVRLRRDFTQLIDAIAAHALLHRALRQLDSASRIIAQVEPDYAVARELLGDLLAESSGVKLRDTERATLDAVAELQTADELVGVTARQVAEKLNLDRSTAQRRIGNLRAKNYLVNLEGKGQRGRYRVEDENVAVVQMLPTVEELQERLAEAAGDDA